MRVRVQKNVGPDRLQVVVTGISPVENPFFADPVFGHKN
jgi:hypothetical protein